MQIIINKERLIKEVSHVIKAVAAKTNIPILTGIKLEATEEGLKLTGSDSDFTIQVLIPKEEEGSEIVNVKETGGIVLNAKTFAEIVKRMPSDDVKISTKELRASIAAQKAIFKLNGLNVEEFPKLPEIQENQVIAVNTKELKKLINNTFFAVSKSDTRPVLTGVNWSLKDHQLICTATDSHRLGQLTTEFQSESKFDANITIPGKSLADIYKILDESISETQIIFTENQVLFKCGNVLMYSRLLEGNYPDTSRLIPTESKTDLMICSKEFIQAVDRACILDKDRSIVKLKIEDNHVELSAESPEIGKVTEDLIADSIEGDDLTISFNAKYLTDALKTFEGKQAKLSFTTSMRPFTLVPEGDDSAVHLVLPVRTF